MFKYASAFNQDISDWALSSVGSISQMFHGASSFNQDLGWCLDVAFSSRGAAFYLTDCGPPSCGVDYYDGRDDCGYEPTRKPTREPTREPTHEPTRKPTPSEAAAYLPTYRPTVQDTCSNGKKDGEESDVDCGGPPPCPRCEMEKQCRVDQVTSRVL